MNASSFIKKIYWIPFLAVLLVYCSPDKKMRKAFNQGQYQRVINYYLKKLENNPNDARANYLIAESFRLSNRIKEAEPFYAKAGGRGVDEDTVKFHHAQALKAAGNYEGAREKLEELRTSTQDEKLKTRATKVLDGLNSLDNLEQKPN